MLTANIENYSQDKAQMQTLQALGACMACEVCGNTRHLGNDCLETQKVRVLL